MNHDIVFSNSSYAWGYRKVYEQFAYAIQQKYPDLHVEGDNYPPPTPQAILSQVLGITKIILIILVATGQNPFTWLNMQTPSVFAWAIENKVSI